MAKALLTPGRIAVLVTVCAVGAGIVATGGGMFSPGALNAQPKGRVQIGGVSSHAELGGKCSACHAPPWSGQTMADRCTSCHTDVRGQIDAHQPLHGRFTNGTQCRTCHTEHKGEHAALTDLSTFDHNCAAFALTGKHTSVDCTSCHTTGTYKGTPATCIGCHAEPKVHRGKFGTDCKQCHTTATWENATVPTGGPGAAFDHSRTAFPLTGHHTMVDCKQCHVNNTFKGTPTSCVSCHAEPKVHRGKFGTDCKQCHTTATWENATVPTGGPGAAFDHDLTAFKLTGKHKTVDCKQCHVDNKFKGTPTSCVSCHAEPKVHTGKFGNECSKCHTTSTWTGATLGDFKHTFPINHGRKSRGGNSCNTCHAAADAYKTYTCYGCHEHTPAKVARQHKKGLNLDNCAKCHRTGRGRGRERAEGVRPAIELCLGRPEEVLAPLSVGAVSCPRDEWDFPIREWSAPTDPLAPLLTATARHRSDFTSSEPGPTGAPDRFSVRQLGAKSVGTVDRPRDALERTLRFGGFVDPFSRIDDPRGRPVSGSGRTLELFAARRSTFE
jgi:hypothetical protein